MKNRPLVILWLLLMAAIIIWFQFIYDIDSSVIACQEGIFTGKVTRITSGKLGVNYVLEDTLLQGEKKVRVGKMLCTTKDSEKYDVKVGNIVRIKGTYSNFSKPTNPGGFHEQLYYKSQDYVGKIQIQDIIIVNNKYDRLPEYLRELRNFFSARLSKVMNSEDAGIMSAMILGDKTLLDKDIKELFESAGISHILAISGLHISLIGMGLFNFLRKYLIKMQYAAIFTVTFLLLYGELTGFPVATTRAVLMMVIAMLGKTVGKYYDPLSAIALSGIFTLINEPLQLFQCGFQLSYASVLGILLFDEAIKRLEIENIIAKTIIQGLALFLTTFPIICWYYFEICPYSVIINMLVLPLMSLLVGVGFVGCICLIFNSMLAEFILSTAHFILKYYKLICHGVNYLPYNKIIIGRPSVVFMVVYYGIILAVIGVFLVDYNRKKLSGLAGLAILIFFFAKPKYGFVYIQGDVGQGDMEVIICDNRTFLIDGGSTSKKNIAENVIEPVLKFYGRDRIDEVFITHGDEDHTSGLIEMLDKGEKRDIRICRVGLPGIENKDKNYLALEEKIRRENISIDYICRKDSLRISDKLTFDCLHPRIDFPWKEPNDYSLTFMINYKNYRILTTGDLEVNGEEDVLESMGNSPMSVDILKVGHHGSKSSTSDAFLAYFSPKYAFASAGVNNRYGHPAREVVDRIKSFGTFFLNTAESGAIIVSEENRRLNIKTMLEK
ncbi:MAG: DNA internalization-related competence protein ComEC/Rec2 [Eubacterium sp.]|nr:DNA internalization-related competence protein ComEC/Rec2 [Eubacterium sp.]